MIRKMIISFAAVVFVIGCARVQVMAPKEPIKVDIAMRLDVYQHVEKDIDMIESIVSGNKVSGKPLSWLDNFSSVAYAQDGLSAEVEEAAMRRKARYGDLSTAESQGQIGENSSGLVELRSGTLSGLVSEENSDRMIIYRSIAAKNGTSVEEVQKLYAKRLQRDASAGTPIEPVSGSGWVTK